MAWFNLNYWNEEIYLAFCYFPPENNVFYNSYKNTIYSFNS